MARKKRAQALLLESVLNGKPLPGMDRVLTFPELEAGSDTVLLVDDRDPAELELPSQVRLAGSNEIENAKTRQRYTPVLEFLDGEAMPGKVSVRLRLSRAGGGDVLPLGEIVATFADTDPLTAAEPTHVRSEEHTLNSSHT